MSVLTCALQSEATGSPLLAFAWLGILCCPGAAPLSFSTGSCTHSCPLPGPRPSPGQNVLVWCESCQGAPHSLPFPAHRFELSVPAARCPLVGHGHVTASLLAPTDGRPSRSAGAQPPGFSRREVWLAAQVLRPGGAARAQKGGATGSVNGGGRCLVRRRSLEWLRGRGS